MPKKSKMEKFNCDLNFHTLTKHQCAQFDVIPSSWISFCQTLSMMKLHSLFYTLSRRVQGLPLPSTAISIFYFSTCAAPFLTETDVHEEQSAIQHSNLTLTMLHPEADFTIRYARGTQLPRPLIAMLVRSNTFKIVLILPFIHA